MYKKIEDKPIAGKLMSALLCSFGEHEKDSCRKLFPDITERSVVIYSTDRKKLTILGYYTLDSKRIEEAQFFHTLIQNTERLSGKRNASGFLNMPCIHISQWEFDESLRNEGHLFSIFTILMASLSIENDSFLWVDRSEPAYYPLKKEDVNLGYHRAISYFVELFLGM